MSDLVDGLALAFSLGAFGFSFLAWKRAEFFNRLFREVFRLLDSIINYTDAATTRLKTEAGPGELPPEGEVRGVAWAGTGLGVPRGPR